MDLNGFFETIMNASWLQDIFFLIMQVVMGLVGILLLPFSLVIKTFMPEMDSALANIEPMFNYASTYTGWIISAFAIPSIVITLMVSYYSFVVLAKLGVWGGKLAIRWYTTFK